MVQARVWTLHDLLTAIEINNWDRRLWFQGAVLKVPVLMTPDATCARFISNCWLPLMKQHIPDLRIVVASEPAKDKPVVEKKSVWKAGKEPAKTRLGGLD